MPSLDAFLGLQLEDEDGIDSWLMAHQFRHQSYSYAASLKGIQVPLYDLSQYPDDTWFNNHSNAHYALQPLMVPDQTVSLIVLTQYVWDSDQDFQTWMQMHTLIHQRLDQGIGIFS